MVNLAENRKARFDYAILEEFEAGIELLGHEVKAVKAGKVTIAGSFVLIRGGEAYLLNTDIQPYQAGNISTGYEATRTRRLLLKKKEIAYLQSKTDEKGLTLVPISLYNRGGKIKVRVALVRYKNKHDKRASIKEREARREMRER